MHARPGEGYRISPKLRKLSELKDGQIAVRRLFSSVEKGGDHVVLNDPKVARVLEDHARDGIQRAIAGAIAEAKKELKKEMDNFMDAQDIDTLKLLTNARTIRCLVDAWVESKEGKEALRVMNKITKSGDILRDIKTCIQQHDEEKLHRFLVAIDGVASLPGGQGLVDLMAGYLHANVLIHKKLSPGDLSVIQDRVASGYNYGLGVASEQWLTLIMSALTSSH